MGTVVAQAIAMGKEEDEVGNVDHEQQHGSDQSREDRAQEQAVEGGGEGGGEGGVRVRCGGDEDEK